MSNSVTLVDEGVVAVVGGDGLSPPAMLSLCRSVKATDTTKQCKLSVHQTWERG